MGSGSIRWFAWRAALAAAVAVAGCGAEDAEIGDRSQDIIGGVALRSARYDAVGAFGYADGAGGFFATCTGTLITPSVVLTSGSCYTFPGDNFVIGPDARAPRQVATVASLAWDAQGSGFVLVRLTAPVPGVAPIEVALLDPARQGTRFVGVGYGVQTTRFQQGTRRAGSMTFQGSGGAVMPMLFGSYQAFVAEVATDFFPDLDVHDPANQEWLISFYEGWSVTASQAWFGGATGDAQACFVDHGGPMLLTEGGTTALHGVMSWLLPPTERLPCDYGAAYEVITPAAKDFIDYELACAGIPRQGTCDGTAVVRCASREEGGYRPLRTDCGDLGLMCGRDEAGELGCVDDPCDGIAPAGQCDGDIAIRCSRPAEGPRRPLDLDCSELLQTCGFVDGEVACVDPT
jgi:hypothetical protein